MFFEISKAWALEGFFPGGQEWIFPGVAKKTFPGVAKKTFPGSGKSEISFYPLETKKTTFLLKL